MINNKHLDYLSCSEKKNPDKATCMDVFNEPFDGRTSWILQKDITKNWVEIVLKKKY